MHPNGNIYMSHMISLIPRGMDRLEERLEKMRIFCQILHERLKKAAGKSQGPDFLLVSYFIEIDNI